MEQSILNFAKQFEFNPGILNSQKLKDQYRNYIIGGMGGSVLAGEFLQSCFPEIDIKIHRNYGCPQFNSATVTDALFIAISYSGNTEETLDFADEVYSRGYDLAVISCGGKLAEFANQNNLPFIQIPDTNIEPRMATGFISVALASLINGKILDELKPMSEIVPEDFRTTGEDIAETLKNKIPVFYSSEENRPVAYNWKIKMNETAKIPAFLNVFPELNHNEIQGYGLGEHDGSFLENLHVIIFSDSSDDSRISKRMEISENLLKENGISVTNIYLEGKNQLEKFFRSVLIADWTAFSLANFYQIDPASVPIINEFKKRNAK